jgi:uncharacterized membrane protein/predicted DsbA family dithiol-disulfide isomerase
VTAAVGFAASLAGLVDSLGAAPTFCAASGCETVRESAWAHPLGVPMPALGVAFFAAMLALTAISRPRVRLAGALAGAVFALLLICVQAFVIGAWCKLCLVADFAALLHFLAVTSRASTLRPRQALLGLPLAAASAAILHLWAAPPALPDLPEGTPECVLREQRPGQVTVVEFLDFECPFCRKNTVELDAALAEVDDVRLVRKMVPMPMHHGALPAALAWCCADAQGKGDAMAHALFTADPSELTPQGCEKIAASVGVDLARYRRDLADPATRARVTADLTDASHAGVASLPTMFIAGERVVGAGMDRDAIVADLRAAAD